MFTKVIKHVTDQLLFATDNKITGVDSSFRYHHLLSAAAITLEFKFILQETSAAREGCPLNQESDREASGALTLTARGELRPCCLVIWLRSYIPVSSVLQHIELQI